MCSQSPKACSALRFSTLTETEAFCCPFNDDGDDEDDEEKSSDVKPDRKLSREMAVSREITEAVDALRLSPMAMGLAIKIT